MQTLALKKPLTAKEPQVAVAAGLKPGRYRVQLVVTGPSGSSQPAAMTINVVEGLTPTPMPIPMPTPAPVRPTDLTPVRTTGRIGRLVKPKPKPKRIP